MPLFENQETSEAAKHFEIKSKTLREILGHFGLDDPGIYFSEDIIRDSEYSFERAMQRFDELKKIATDGHPSIVYISEKVERGHIDNVEDIILQVQLNPQEKHAPSSGYIADMWTKNIARRITPIPNNNIINVSSKDDVRWQGTVDFIFTQVTNLFSENPRSEKTAFMDSDLSIVQLEVNGSPHTLFIERNRVNIDGISLSDGFNLQPNRTTILHAYAYS